MEMLSSFDHCSSDSIKVTKLYPRSLQVTIRLWKGHQQNCQVWNVNMPFTINFSAVHGSVNIPFVPKQHMDRRILFSNLVKKFGKKVGIPNLVLVTTLERSTPQPAPGCWLVTTRIRYYNFRPPADSKLRLQMWYPGVWGVLGGSSHLVSG